MRVMLFVARFPVIHRLVHRGPKNRACLICRHVWSWLEAQPGLSERIKEADAQFAAGKGIRYEVRDGGLFRVDG